MLFRKRDEVPPKSLQDDAGVVIAGAVHHKAAADALHGLSAELCAQLIQGLLGGQGAVLLDGALDDLAGLQRVAGLLDGAGDDAVLADVEDGLHGVGHGAEVSALLAGHGH